MELHIMGKLVQIEMAETAEPVIEHLEIQMVQYMLEVGAEVVLRSP